MKEPRWCGCKQWTDKELDDCLGGCAFFQNQIRDSRDGIKNDCKLIKTEHDTNDGDNSFVFPSFDSFNDMLGAVSSRAFDITTTDSNNAEQ